jgi:hypothetical protein
LAQQAYRTFRHNPYDPALYFKKVKGTSDLYSIRVTFDYRALGHMTKADEVVWDWIGTHEEYSKMIP